MKCGTDKRWDNPFAVLQKTINTANAVCAGSTTTVHL